MHDVASCYKARSIFQMLQKLYCGKLKERTMKHIKRIFIVLLLTLAFAFSASATETYRGINNSNHKRFTKKITHSVTSIVNLIGCTHHNNAYKIV